MRKSQVILINNSKYGKMQELLVVHTCINIRKNQFSRYYRFQLGNKKKNKVSNNHLKYQQFIFL